MGMKFKRIIYLKYFTAPNFGDALSPYIVNKLSGLVIVDKTLTINSTGEFIAYIWNCIRSKQFWGLKLIELPWQKVLLSVGSILKFSNKNCVVWGSGFMNYGERCIGGRILAVRGKLSNDKLKALGLIMNDVSLGDPALLLPIICASRPEKKHKIGIIPHYQETDFFLNSYNHKIIDLRTKKINDVIIEITQCEYVLSSSLHGIIVAHAYGVPALWIADGCNKDTDGFKFHDYLTSVRVCKYEPFSSAICGESESHIIELFANNKDISVVNPIVLEEIQRNLLKVAPFELKKKYRKVSE